MLILNIVLRIEHKAWEALHFAGTIDVPQNICAELTQASGPGQGMVLGEQGGTILTAVVRRKISLLPPRE